MGTLGVSVGEGVGCLVGTFVGVGVGRFVGESVGRLVGTFVGAGVGRFVGEGAGLGVTGVIGAMVGDLVGDFVGAGAMSGVMHALFLDTRKLSTDCWLNVLVLLPITGYMMLFVELESCLAPTKGVRCEVQEKAIVEDNMDQNGNLLTLFMKDRFTHRGCGQFRGSPTYFVARYSY